MPILIHQISGVTLIASLIVLTLVTLYKIKTIFSYLKKIPKSLLGISLGFSLWGLFFVPKNFSSRGEFGVWFFSEANLQSWGELLRNIRTPIYYWRTKLLSELLGGISYEFIANLNFITFIFGSLLIYIIVKNIIQNDKAAYAASLFFIINPILFTFSFTEDYAILALFFSLLSLFFASIQIDSGDDIFLLLAMASALLSAGSRVEYIFFPFLFILFYFLFIFKKEKSNKLQFGSLLLFLVIIIPRTISTLIMYFGDIGHDPGLSKTAPEYSGNPIKYVFEVLGSNYTYFIKNIREAWGYVTNPYNLTLLFFILGLSSLFLLLKNKNKAKLKKAVVFFLFSFFFLVIFYSYLHAELGMGGYRYRITIFTPLIISAGISFGLFLKNKPIIFYSGLHLIFIISFITTLFPLGIENGSSLMIDEGLKELTQYNYEETRREYNKYKSLTYENKIYNILNKKEPDVPTGERGYFITNGTRNVLHSMPINGNFIAIRSRDELTASKLAKKLSEVKEGDKIYVSQSEMGFTSNQIDGYHYVDPDIFEKKIKLLFDIKREIISYQHEGHHAFLYEVVKK
ncbi:MAG: glycosyltransferase family 39 protein [Candidatus Woesearchaeota archaeon]